MAISNEEGGENLENSENPESSENNDKTCLLNYIEETNLRLNSKNEIRNKNLNVQNSRPNENYFSKLDSNLKKNTTFVKKVKNFSASQLESLLKDISGLNLTKYISEICAALVDAKLKMTDIAPAVKLCSELHQIYSDFAQHLFENWQKVLSIKIGEKIANPSKLRVDLRFYSDLVNAGLFNSKPALALLGNILTTLINMDKDDHFNTSIILSFCRHCGEDYAGLVPRKIRELSEKYSVDVPRSNFLSQEKQQNVRSLLKDYYLSLCKHIGKDNNEMLEFEKQNRRILQTKGELNADRKERLEQMKISYDKMLSITQNFAEILDENIPELVTEIVSKEEEDVVLNVTSIDTESQSQFAQDAIWCDLETKRFYCDLPDLQVFLPPSFCNEANKNKQQIEETVTEEVLDAEIPEETLEDEGKIEEPPIEEDPEDITSTTINNKIVLDAFLNNLPNCINRELIDNAAIDFLVTLNTKNNRKKLVRTLFGVNRTRLDLLPFYARFVAILYSALPEVGNELSQMLRTDFKYHVRKKDQINIESKIKVVRFIGEMVKFGLYSKIEALFCLKVLLNDFSNHHIEMACNLLEICGRYLFCSPESHQRTKIYLEQLMRKKNVMLLDSRYVTQIENAYYYVNPPENVAVPKKERPVMHQFIRKLLYMDLQKNNTDKILRLIRKLNWTDPDISAYAVKCLTNAFNLKYFNIRCLANLLAGLVSYQEEVGTRVVDGVLEDIRLGMEINLPKYYQRRVAQIKYLGELYNYRMVESADVFKVLYSLITFGVTMDYNNSSPLDPPENLFRIRLACVLLETSGTYFSSGSSKRRLDYYLVFLQAYYWFKKSDPLWGGNFPVYVDYLLRDTVISLRPKLKLCQNYEEAQEEVQNVRKVFGIGANIGNEVIEDQKPFGLDSIAETDTEQDVEQDEEISESAQNFQDETTTEDEAPELQQSDDEMNDNTDVCNELSENEEENSLMEINGEDPENLSKGLPVAPKYISCSEDEDFVSALDKMVSENIQERMRETVKPSQLDISVPMSVRGGKKTYDRLQDADPSELDTMDFTLMVRKGNKQVYKNFKADVDSELAQNLKDQELVLKEEKQRVKRLTLNITERLEEEDYQEMLQQQQKMSTQNLNRERKKYQHPKGAPDADLIFGPKRVR